jgi:hypothetical protein
MCCLFRALLVLLLLTPAAVSAEDLTSWEFGMRGGGDATGLNENYTVAEVYLLRELPWQLDFEGGAVLRARADAGVGYIEASDDEGGWLAMGGDLVLGLFDGTLEFEAGFRPAWLKDHKYGDDHFGGEMQFASHAGATVVYRQLTFSYRFQHMSNAGIYDHNPGLDLHLVGLGARF